MSSHINQLRPGTGQNEIVTKITSRVGSPNLLAELDSKLSMSEINTLLLELYRRKTREMSPADILRQYAQNRFAKPSDLDPVLSYRFSADLLEVAGKYGYTALDLSPVAVLGSCSVVAAVDQNKILSALRGTEVLADATNVLALHIATLKGQQSIKKKERLRYCAVHRHIRAQKFQGKNQLPHFLLYSMVISGADEGNLKFQKETLGETINFYHEYLCSQSYLKNPRFIIWPRGGEKGNFTEEILEYIREHCSWDISEEKAPSENDYYRGLQFKIKARYKDTEYEIGDGGFVDWTGKLLQNEKERMLVSGIGLERLIKMSGDLF